MSFPDDIEIFSGQLKRFSESVIDSKCLLQVEATSFFVLITIYPFQATYFLAYFYFYFRNTVNMLSKMVWNYNKNLVSQVLQFGLFVQICHQVSLSLKLDNAIWICFLLISLVFETWSDHYLLPNVLIKIGFLIPS